MFHGMHKNWQIAICSMVLCIIPPNFRLLAEILKELEREHCSGRTDGLMVGQTDGQMARRNDRGQYPSTPMAAEGKKNSAESDLLLLGN